MRISKRRFIESIFRRLSIITESLNVKVERFKTIGAANKYYGTKLSRYGKPYTDGDEFATLVCTGNLIGNHDYFFYSDSFQVDDTNVALIGYLSVTYWDDSLKYPKYCYIHFGRLDLKGGRQEAETQIRSLYNKLESLMKSESTAPYDDSLAKGTSMKVPSDNIDSVLDDIISILKDDFGMYVYLGRTTKNTYNKYKNLSTEYLSVFNTSWID